MLRLIPILSCLALVATGCDDPSDPQTYRGETARIKPLVTIVPVIDNTKTNYTWSLSEEFTTALFSHLNGRNHLSLTDARGIKAKTKTLEEQNNPFGPEISWIKDAFQKDSFVVFLELVEHEEVFNQDRKKVSDISKCSADLKMSMRVRAFDLRQETPKVILQEIFHKTHHLPRQFTSENFYQVSWEDTLFNVTPLGLAHAQFTKEIAKRIEDYILINLIPQ